MQAAKEQKKTNQWMATAVSIIVIGMAIILFGVAINQLGLLNGLAGEETAVPDGAINITIQAMRFGQPELRVKAGEKVTLILENHDLYEHSFDIDGLDLHVAMDANGRSVVKFTATEPGIYDIYCAVQGHREAGMISTLTVEP